MTTVGFVDEDGRPLGVDDWECPGAVPAVGDVVRPRVNGREDRWVVGMRLWDGSNVVILAVSRIDGFNNH